MLFKATHKSEICARSGGSPLIIAIASTSATFKTPCGVEARIQHALLTSTLALGCRFLLGFKGLERAVWRHFGVLGQIFCLLEAAWKRVGSFSRYLEAGSR